MVHTIGTTENALHPKEDVFRAYKKEGANMPITIMLAPGRRNGGGFFLHGSPEAGVGSLILYSI